MYQTACATKTGLASDAVIGRIRFYREGGSPETTIRKRKKSALIEIRSKKGRLVIHLLERNNTSDVKSEKPTMNNKEFWRRFTANEILDWVKKVGDNNPIHRTSKPIVPGYMMLLPWLDIFPKNDLDIRFRHAVRADENIFVARSEDVITAFTNDAFVFTLTILPRRLS